ncbi:precorrin-3B synthase [Methylopila jiangsuensis]|uniref:Precorrin-3B synthase n=1 Tax=Methylopila jiangsuensis TaxID=586230 RepID=A0A9W6JF27_9HYPH|nr:precorrin-3B synthase [Methylopila jiangsuensis]MDR6285503.1 precorrin-3B synthase [Methylopila jiangsuensis]GLK75261.1 precorrin-3B synthase [Methylopila jiangsuensis]
MAECPGVAHLAEMADGGLARLRAPGGRLRADQARSVAELAETLGSGALDLTNRANLQIRGLQRDAGPALASALGRIGLYAEGPADRRRNVLLDPLAGLDPTESADLTPVAAALDRALTAQDWIGELSPKFAFALDGGGASGVAAVASDVALLAMDGRLRLALAGVPLGVSVAPEEGASAGVLLAKRAAQAGPDARARDLDAAALRRALAEAGLGQPAAPADAPWPAALRPVFGLMTQADGRFSSILPVPVGRLAAAMLRFAAEAAEQGEGELRLAPWSAIVIPHLDEARATDALERAQGVGFLPPDLAARLRVRACAGAPACVRAREPAKALALAVLAEAARRPELAPETPRSLHISACPKGCAGAAPADLLLLGAGDRDGYALHAHAAPRRPGGALGRCAGDDPAAVLSLLSAMPGAS